MIEDLRAALGDKAVLTGADCAPWSHDWTGQYDWTPLCVVRPASTQEVSAVMQLAHAAGVAVVPVSGNTGLAGGTRADGAVMLSLDRMNAVRDIRPEARLAVVEAGVILSDLHDAVAAQGLSFPMTFGAKGSARMGGLLATNAGGSNVLRYGNTRDLVLGVEAVLADGRVVDLLSELHKNNTGYDLRHLLIGSEGTLGIITAAVVKLVPAPKAFATAMVALDTVSEALTLLNRLQDVTGGAVEAFEFMPGRYMRAHAETFPEARMPFDELYGVNVLVELGATAPRDVQIGEDGQVPLTAYLEEVLGGLLEEGAVLDAVVASNEAQRSEMWARREAAAELSLAHKPLLIADVAVALDRVETFLDKAGARMAQIDPDFDTMIVSHLGDGNIHYTVWPSEGIDLDEVTETVEDVVLELGGSFSAEHGVGTSKLASMRRRKDPVALDMMRAIKQALDPKGILNPGKVIPS
ncbi:FAD-binding oxidoreductase [Tropicibacter naphthalenivorans]|uniref:Putative FAD-linked oxidoreductase n=1 Tax=Tropicibacter naphthalenivorans TaxID=441103 RepID=A0A0P1G0K5_9RHOB|nr:FAD-binding oxidoreductase [Tropicibacter naphthalenivorans]CUH75269.1 putative FAD-linked oxidoreductase [Tropicibacter naphthalenivorans]SMC45322.1 FAD/FMN-containing dehydrogenase [Tropicibacter naphthalenivorans]